MTYQKLINDYHLTQKELEAATTFKHFANDKNNSNDDFLLEFYRFLMWLETGENADMSPQEEREALDYQKASALEVGTIQDFRASYCSFQDCIMLVKMHRAEIEFLRQASSSRTFGIPSEARS